MAETSQANRPRPVSFLQAFKTHAIEHKIEVMVLFTRGLTMFFTFMYFLPLFGNYYNFYYKALIANAATSALRLHQRLPRMDLSMECLSTMLSEDSCHYIAYSLIFIYVIPLSLVLLPVFLFALIHFASYSLNLLFNHYGQNSWWGIYNLMMLMGRQYPNILKVIACIEIILLPFCVFLILVGRAGLLTLFVYYQFLTLRCKSRRNPTTRNMFYAIKITLASIANKPGTPDFWRRFINSFIVFISKVLPSEP